MGIQHTPPRHGSGVGDLTADPESGHAKVSVRG